MGGFDGKQLAFGWIVGYFLLTFPIRMALPHDFIYSLFHSILGVSIAIAFLWIGRKE